MPAFIWTAASYMASLGVGKHVISKFLNHAEPGVTGVYNLHRYDAENRNALEIWESKLLDIAGTTKEKPCDEQTPTTTL